MKGKASTRLLRRLHQEGGEVCGKGRLPAGWAPLQRRGRAVALRNNATGAWCVRLMMKERRA
jgi:hypothetical protein